MSKLFGQPIKAVNLGSRDFYEDLVKQGVEAVHLNWKPAANGDAALLAALAVAVCAAAYLFARQPVTAQLPQCVTLKKKESNLLL